MAGIQISGPHEDGPPVTDGNLIYPTGLRESTAGIKIFVTVCFVRTLPGMEKRWTITANHPGIAKADGVFYNPFLSSLSILLC